MASAVCLTHSSYPDFDFFVLALEEALQVLAAREPVYFDPVALQLICGIPPKSTIRTRFGTVTCLLMRSTDGVLICAHSCGGGVTAYLASGNVVQDNEGAFVDSSVLPPVQRNPEYEDDEDLEIERTPRTTKGQPTRIDLRGCFINHGDMMRLSHGLASNVR
ncbi:hypothetical protein Poli38472_009784 [Pythium oligandrum]|uniref:Uncharacterized protein n=1 Tax=Pythium oligandrum TaxID=41045 RepID=A0A8K1CGA4_PYTOL|nr:hypothetical protein Poli38472_009784 [Pythium oligandrum]|eukprot:TMW62291.1 hypothetical protein Poli38472_009784 [Pythium oligandrum]